MFFIPEGKSAEDYTAWGQQIGQPSSFGVALCVSISYSSDGKPDVVVEGVVGVPRPPEDDLERSSLATTLSATVSAAVGRVDLVYLGPDDLTSE